MKYQKLTALLDLGTIELHSNFFGTKEPFAKLTEEQLTKLEAALEERDVTALETKISELENEVKALTTEKGSVAEALQQAYEHNGLQIAENATMAESIATMGEKCKEFATAKNTHSLTKTDGLEKEDDELQNSFFDPKAAHNQLT